MKKSTASFCLALYCLLTAAQATSVKVTPSPRLPAKVRAFIARAEECVHWGGEDPYDAERSAEISRATIRLRCLHVEADRDALLHAYRRNAGVVKALAEAPMP